MLSLSPSKKFGMRPLLFLSLMGIAVPVGAQVPTIEMNSPHTIEDENADVVVKDAPVHKDPANQRGFDFRVFSGISQFQDVQLPVVGFQISRADGTEIGAERVAHSGIPVGAEGSYWWIHDQFRSAINVKALKASAQTGPKETLDSSITGMDLQGVHEWAFQAPYMLGVDASLSRENYKNVSTGHILKTLLVGGRAGYRLRSNYSVTAGVATSLWGRLAYDNGKSFGGENLQGTSLKSRRLFVESELMFDRQTSVSLGLQQTHSDIAMNDVRAYKEAGLPLVGVRSGSEAFVLQTTHFTLGFIKKL